MTNQEELWQPLTQFVDHHHQLDFATRQIEKYGGRWKYVERGGRFSVFIPAHEANQRQKEIDKDHFPMNKTCLKCGLVFETRNEKHRLCKVCHTENNEIDGGQITNVA